MLLCSTMRGLAQIAMPDTVCVGMARLYHVNDPTIPSTYTWAIDGITQASTKNEIGITWSRAGTFQLTVQEHAISGCDGDIRGGLVYVVAPPLANAGPDSVICFGNSIQLKGGGGNTYHWSPSTYLSDANVSNPFVAIPAAGTYQYVLSVSNNGCPSVVKDTVLLTMLPPLKLFAGNDSSVTINQPFQLNAIDVNNAGFTSYKWSPSFGLNNAQIKNPVAVLNSNITYTVTAQTLGGCSATDDIVIKVFNGPEIYVPDAFTPNNDGLNDIFKPTYVGITQVKYFNVFNRYGQLVFTTTNPSAGWDGSFKGEKQAPMAYVWMVEGVGPGGTSIKKKGTVMLIR